MRPHPPHRSLPMWTNDDAAPPTRITGRSPITRGRRFATLLATTNPIGQLTVVAHMAIRPSADLPLPRRSARQSAVAELIVTQFANGVVVCRAPTSAGGAAVLEDPGVQSPMQAPGIDSDLRAPIVAPRLRSPRWGPIFCCRGRLHVRARSRQTVPVFHPTGNLAWGSPRQWDGSDVSHGCGLVFGSVTREQQVSGTTLVVRPP